MDRQLKAPYLSPQQIRDSADNFLKSHWDGKLPIDIEDIIETKLEYSIDPIFGIKAEFDTDGYLTSSLDQIFVDADSYEKPQFANRYRFTIAHELGHSILHPEFWQQLGIKSIDDYRTFCNSIPEKEYRWLEYHANEFAGRVLVPPGELRKYLASSEIQEKINQARDAVPMISEEELIPYIAVDCGKLFQVSNEVIEIRIEREDITLL